MVGDIHAFVSDPVSNGYCGEAHFDQKGNVAVSEVMDSDTFDPGSSGSSGHFPVQTVLGTSEDPVIRLHRIKHFQIILHFFNKKIRHLYGTIALGSFRIGDHIPAFEPLIGLGDGNCLSLEIKVGRGQGQQLTFPDTAPVQHFKCVVKLGIVHGLLGELPVFLLRPELHFLGSCLAHITDLGSRIGRKSIVFAGMVENGTDLIVGGFQIGRGEGLSVFVLAVQNLILSSKDVFGKDFSDFAVFEVGKDLGFNDMLFGHPGVFLYPLFHIEVAEL